jgi:3-dehydroquinate synthase
MTLRKIQLDFERHGRSYEVRIGSRMLETAGEWAKEFVPSARKIALVSNPTVFGIYGGQISASISSAGFEISQYLMPDGEEFKDLENLAQVLEFFNENRITRADAVISLGGGVVGDLAGFAASVHMRGVEFLQIPTTLLAMIDASVGGKTGVNSRYGKNLIGSFYQPRGVLADIEALKTLDQRELAAGMYEAVKQSALSGRQELEDLRSFLKRMPASGLSKGIDDPDLAEGLIGLVEKQVRFKALVVSGDANEAFERADNRSRKILNFGHTTAHALEKCTGYSRFRHGEAVGYGILVAGEISKRLEICPADSIDLLNDVVRVVGVLPDTSNISVDDVLAAIELDKKSGGDAVQWILLEDIGKPLILSGPDIPPSVIKESIDQVISQWSAG